MANASTRPRLTTLKPRVPTLGAVPAKQGGWTATRQTSSTARGYGWAWQKKREQVLKRDCYLCQVCARTDRVTPAEQVDHIVCKAEWLLTHDTEDGCEDGENLQSICDACHKAKTAAEAARARARGSPLVQMLFGTPGGGRQARTGSDL